MLGRVGATDAVCLDPYVEVYHNKSALQEGGEKKSRYGTEQHRMSFHPAPCDTQICSVALRYAIKYG